MRGLHLTADLSGCRRDQAALTEPDALRALCFAAIRKAGLEPVGHCFHAFPAERGEPRGVTCVVLLAESHLAVHTWPELDAVTLDVYVCHRHGDNSAKAEAVIEALLAAFAPQSVKRERLERGMSQLPALILCAGRGERMRPLTDRTPKPLLPVHGKPLVVWHLEALARDGVREVVINTAWLEEQFPAALGDGSAFGLAIRYSMEGRQYGGALETAGGIVAAAPLLGAKRFWVVAGDAWLPDFHFDAHDAAAFEASHDLGSIWLVPNPDHHPDGDFALGDARDADRVLTRDDRHARGSYTYSTVGLFDRKLVAGIALGERSALRPHLDAAIAQRKLAGRLYPGRWADVGTPARWQALQGPG